MAALLAARGAAAQTIPAAGAAPLVWPECQPGQVEVMIFATFHFAQTDDPDIFAEAHQSDLAIVLDRLADWAPDRVAVEFPHARQPELTEAYRAYAESEADAITSSKNEIHQIGFRLAKRLGHTDLDAVDVRMNLWHDSIQVFDDTWPGARDALRREWPARFAPTPPRAGRSLIEILRAENEDDPPANSELYAGFLPLVEGEVYAGALKLRPWYDRNLRTLQNLFRRADPTDRRLLLVIGSAHLRVLKQMLEMTPQMCPVSALPLLGGR